MKKFLFTFLLLIAPMFNAHAIVGGTDSGQQTIVDTCTSVQNWTEGTPVDGNTWSFNNDDGCTLYRKAPPTCTGTTVRPSLYMFSCGAGCYWQPNAAYNSNTTGTRIPGACKKCPSGKWSDMNNTKNTCPITLTNEVYYPTTNNKYCQATACQPNKPAENVDGYSICTGGVVFGDQNLCVCKKGYYKQGNECKKCPDNGTSTTTPLLVYKSNGVNNEDLNNSNEGIKSCALDDTSSTYEDETGIFTISGNGLCNY